MLFRSRHSDTHPTRYQQPATVVCGLEGSHGKDETMGQDMGKICCRVPASSGCTLLSLKLLLFFIHSSIAFQLQFFFFWFSFPPPIPINYKPLLFILLSNWKVGGLCNRYRRSYPFSMLITFHYLAFVSHDSFLYLSAVVTCDNPSSSIFQTTTTYTLRPE